MRFNYASERELAIRNADRSPRCCASKEPRAADSRRTFGVAWSEYEISPKRLLAVPWASRLHRVPGHGRSRSAGGYAIIQRDHRRCRLNERFLLGRVARHYRKIRRRPFKTAQSGEKGGPVSENRIQRSNHRVSRYYLPRKCGIASVTSTCWGLWPHGTRKAGALRGGQ